MNDPRIRVTLTDLRRLQAASHGLGLAPQQPVHSALNGRHRSRLRGRGLNFEELRDYLHGDDIRAIDWKTSARTGKPYVKVLTEERDRAVLLAVDQRMAMFFGSRLNMKSVTAAEVAALIGHGVLARGDRVGGVIFNDEQLMEFVPKRSHRALNAMLAEVARQNGQLVADAPVTPRPARLNDVLDRIARLATHDALVVLVTDGSGIDATTKRRLAGIAGHNDVIVVLVEDPLAHNLVADDALVVTDGDDQAEVRLNDSHVRAALTDYTEGRLATVRRWQLEISLSVLPVSAGEETLAQLQQLLGQRSPRRRVR